jgi:hypothetical protein
VRTRVAEASCCHIPTVTYLIKKPSPIQSQKKRQK